jgi:hypothetical protein
VFALSVVAVPAAHAAPLLDVAPGGTEIANVVRAHLPTWVQVADPTAFLYASEGGSQVVSESLVRFTYLRVLAGGQTRLQVEAYDEDGSVSARGWIGLDQVLPSAPGIGWLVAAQATTLWSADANAEPVRQLDRFTPLLMVDGPVQNRIQVWVYRSDFSGVLDKGWIDASATGPALAPMMRVPSPNDRTLSLRGLSASNQQQLFLETVSQAARDSAALTGVPASVTVAQAILESDWGRSQLAQSANNYFGVKAGGSLGNDGVVWLSTLEYDDSGQLYQTFSAFRAYTSLTDSLTDHDRMLETSSRYATAMRVASNPRQFAVSLAQAGYASDPAYADKLVALMDRYNLYQLDA